MTSPDVESLPVPALSGTDIESTCSTAMSSSAQQTATDGQHNLSTFRTSVLLSLNEPDKGGKHVQSFPGNAITPSNQTSMPHAAPASTQTERTVKPTAAPPQTQAEQVQSSNKQTPSSSVKHKSLIPVRQTKISRTEADLVSRTAALASQPSATMVAARTEPPASLSNEPSENLVSQGSQLSSGGPIRTARQPRVTEYGSPYPIDRYERARLREAKATKAGRDATEPPETKLVTSLSAEPEGMPVGNAVQRPQTGFPVRRSSLTTASRRLRDEKNSLAETSPASTNEASEPIQHSGEDLANAVESSVSQKRLSSDVISTNAGENPAITVPAAESPDLVNEESEAESRRSFGEFDPSGHLVRHLSQTAGKWGPILRKADIADEVILGIGDTSVDDSSSMSETPSRKNSGRRGIPGGKIQDAFRKTKDGMSERLNLPRSKTVRSLARAAGSDSDDSDDESNETMRAPSGEENLGADITPGNEKRWGKRLSDPFVEKLEKLVAESYQRKAEDYLEHRGDWPLRNDEATASVAPSKLETVEEEDEAWISPLKRGATSTAPSRGEAAAIPDRFDSADELHPDKQITADTSATSERFRVLNTRAEVITSNDQDATRSAKNKASSALALTTSKKRFPIIRKLFKKASGDNLRSFFRGKSSTTDHGQRPKKPDPSKMNQSVRARGISSPVVISSPAATNNAVSIAGWPAVPIHSTRTSSSAADRLPVPAVNGTSPEAGPGPNNAGSEAQPTTTAADNITAAAVLIDRILDRAEQETDARLKALFIELAGSLASAITAVREAERASERARGAALRANQTLGEMVEEIMGE